jgi:hypothetical protein
MVAIVSAGLPIRERLNVRVSSSGRQATLSNWTTVESA